MNRVRVITCVEEEVNGSVCRWKKSTRTAHYNTTMQPQWRAEQLQEHRQHGRVPVVGNEHAVLTGAEGEGANGLDACLREHAEALRVVDIVRSRLGAVQLGASLAPHLQERKV